jgi:TolB protein
MQTIKTSWLFILILLMACGETAPEPTPPPLLPTPTPTAQIRGEPLPGQLLFVQDGTIWKWSGDGAFPLLGAGVASQPAWSPDGSRIAYVEQGDSYSDLMLANATGEHLQQLTFNGSSQPAGSQERVRASTWALYPAFAPDGNEIVVSGQAGPPFGSPAIEYNLGLFAVNTGSGVARRLFAETEAHCGRAVYAPDGRTIVYTHAHIGAEGYQQLYRLDPITGTSGPFPGAPQPSYDPAFSPDGGWLAFAAHVDGGTDILALPAGGDGSEAIRLTEQGTARAPAFAPDGSKLAFLAIPPAAAGFEIWVADVERDAAGRLSAGPARQLTNDMQVDGDSGLAWAAEPPNVSAVP